MKVWEVKSLFLAEFMRMGLSAYEMRNTWYQFVQDLFESGEINARVFRTCNSLEIA